MSCPITSTSIEGCSSTTSHMMGAAVTWRFIGFVFFKVVVKERNERVMRVLLYICIYVYIYIHIHIYIYC